jgi:hypothetical protein
MQTLIMPTLIAASAYKTLPEAVPGLTYTHVENVIRVHVARADDPELFRSYQAAVRHLQMTLGGIENHGYNQKRVGNVITFEVI